ncbi:MAG: hypothetical protein OXE87_03505 [Chloroflexi bacterium]|nr:hypothetical protein [Chloroflexota bacterium]
MTLRWPPDFPEDCPPEEASPANGIYYYIVKNDPPQWTDFTALYRRNRRLAEARIRQGITTACQTMGLSVLADINDALDRANQFRSIGNIVARLMLTPDAGRILYTPRDNDSHHTWWVPEGYNPGDTATIVLEL